MERACGETKWSLKSLFAYAFEGILAFSTAPLKLAGLIGCLLFLAGVIFISINLIQSLWIPGAVSSFDIIITVVLMLGSLQMLFLYILGAYLSKDYLENKSVRYILSGKEASSFFSSSRVFTGSLQVWP